jgi:hypothetical protein
MNSKKGMVWPEIGWWILLFAIIGMMVLFMIVLKGKGIPIIDKIVSIFTGGSSA